MRKYQRAIAKERMRILGVGNINKKLHLKGEDGVSNWRRVLFGKSGKDAHDAQMQNGHRIKQAKDARKSIAKRQLKKVTA